MSRKELGTRRVWDRSSERFGNPLPGFDVRRENPLPGFRPKKK